MKKFLVFLMTIVALLSCSKQPISKKTAKQYSDTILTLSNDLVSLSISMYGGAYTSFSFNDKQLNPLTFKLNTVQMPANNKNGAVFQGHFLCLGRWGSPTDGEIEEGVPHNGQATNSWWSVESKDKQNLMMSTYAPLDKMNVIRTINVSKTEPLFVVTEEVKNTMSVGRLNNIVQHATMGEPFLQRETIVNSNAAKGFMQSMSYPNPYKNEFTWPNGYADSLKTKIDLTSTNTDSSFVATHIFNDKYGWITASSPSKGLLIGYLWRTSEYPWLNMWNQVVDGKPWAKGLEFGTTGIGRSYQDLLAVNTSFYGRNSYEYLDAGQTVTKSFVCFMNKIPIDFKGVEQIVITNGTIVITCIDGIGNKEMKITDFK